MSAIQSMGRWRPTPGEACHHRSVATLGRLLLFCSCSSCQPRLPFPQGCALEGEEVSQKGGLRLSAWRREQKRVSARGPRVAPPPLPVPATVCHALPCPHLAMAPGDPSCHLSSRLARIGALNSDTQPPCCDAALVLCVTHLLPTYGSSDRQTAHCLQSMRVSTNTGICRVVLC
jgi:hypothetical protein